MDYQESDDVLDVTLICPKRLFKVQVMAGVKSLLCCGKLYLSTFFAKINKVHKFLHNYSRNHIQLSSFHLNQLTVRNIIFH